MWYTRLQRGHPETTDWLSLHSKPWFWVLTTSLRGGGCLYWYSAEGKTGALRGHNSSWILSCWWDLRIKRRTGVFFLPNAIPILLQILTQRQRKVVEVKELSRQHRWKDTSRSWTRRINIVKMDILTKAICRYNVIPIKLPITFLQS